MENCAKALEIAGAVLITVLVISISILAYNNMKVMPEAQEEALSSEQLSKYNMQFESYNTNSLRGTDIISVINKAIDSNKRYDAADTTDPYYVNVIFTLNNPVRSTITTYEWSTSANRFTASTSDATLKIYFEDQTKYELSKDKDKFDQFISLSYESNSETYWSDRAGNKDDSLYQKRYEGNVENKVYYETTNPFSEFKRREFKCDEVHYNDVGRIDSLTFSEV